MLEDYNKRIEAIKGRIECSRDIACYKTGGRPLCKVNDIVSTLPNVCDTEIPLKVTLTFGK